MGQSTPEAVKGKRMKRLLDNTGQNRITIHGLYRDSKRGSFPHRTLNITGQLRPFQSKCHPPVLSGQLRKSD